MKIPKFIKDIGTLPLKKGWEKLKETDKVIKFFINYDIVKPKHDGKFNHIYTYTIVRSCAQKENVKESLLLHFFKDEDIRQSFEMFFEDDSTKNILEQEVRKYFDRSNNRAEWQEEGLDVHSVIDEFEFLLQKFYKGTLTLHERKVEDELTKLRNETKDIKRVLREKAPVVPYREKIIKKHLGPIPLYPEVILGRDEDISAIHHKLFQDTPKCLLLVNGEGGIGKTTVASIYYHRYIEEYEHLIWIVAETSIFSAFSTLALELGLSFAPSLSVERQMEETIKVIMGLRKPCLLIIDNANNLHNLERSYPLLRRCTHLHLLLTTRITTFSHVETYPIKHLPKKEARELFICHYKSHDPGDDELLNQILESIGYNTLAIELLSENLNNFNTILSQEYSLQDLLEDLQENGVLGLRKTSEITTDYRLTPCRPEEIVKAMYTISDLNDAEKTVLSVFSVLPAVNIPYDHLKDLLYQIDSLDKVMLSIVQKGWIELDKSLMNFKCSPVVQEIIRKQNKMRLREDCQDLISSLIIKLAYEPSVGQIKNIPYDQAVIYTSYGEMVCHYFYKIRGDISILLERIGNFHKAYGTLDKELKYFEDFMKLMKELYDSNPQNISFINDLAVSYENMGETHISLGNLSKALQYFEDEKILFKELYDLHPQNVTFKHGLAASYTKLGETHTSLGTLDKALRYFKDFMKLMKELYDSDSQNVVFKNNLAISYLKLGIFYRDQKKDEMKAKNFLRKTKKLWEALYNSFPDYAEFCKNLEWINNALKKGVEP